MKPSTSSPCPQRPLRALAFALSALFATQVHAEANPYYFGISESVTRDSNLYRAPTDVPSVPPVADYLTSTGLVAGIDQPFGRQRFYANGQAQYNKYRHQTDLDNTSYSLKSGLDWSAAERLAGSLSYLLNENLASYSNKVSAISFQEKNVERTQLLTANARYGLVGLLSLEGLYEHSSLNYSAAAFDVYDFSQDAVGVGLKYRPSGILTLGTELRTTRGKHPHGLDGLEDRYRRNDVTLTGAWYATGESTVDFRLGYSRQRYDAKNVQDFSGATGIVSWDYRPTGKLHFTTRLSHDTGQQSTFYQLIAGVPGPVGDTSRVSTMLQVLAQYQFTGKIQLNASARHLHRSLSDPILSGGVLLGHVDNADDTNTFSLGAQYAPTPHWLLACNVNRETRHSSALIASSYPYKDTTATCSVQYTIQ